MKHKHYRVLGVLGPNTLNDSMLHAKPAVSVSATSNPCCCINWCHLAFRLNPQNVESSVSGEESRICYELLSIINDELYYCGCSPKQLQQMLIPSHVQHSTLHFEPL